MSKQLQRFILIGNVILLGVMVVYHFGTLTELVITAAIVLGSGWSVWDAWRKKQREQEALARLRGEETEDAIAVMLASGTLQMVDCQGRPIRVVLYERTALGDPTCVYSARSDLLRCTVNPNGPCESCPHYQMTEETLQGVALELRLRKAARKLNISYEAALARFSNSFAPDPELEAALLAVEHEHPLE